MLNAGCSSVLSGFLRRLFLQVLLEDERALVCISSQQPIYKGPSAVNAAGRLQHPRFGAGHCFRCLPVSVNSTFKEILNRVSGKSLILRLHGINIFLLCTHLLWFKLDLKWVYLKSLASKLAEVFVSLISDRVWSRLFAVFKLKWDCF